MDQEPHPYPRPLLRMPWRTSTHRTDTPREPTWNSLGRASVRSFPDTGHIILMGNQMQTTWLKILSEPFQWIQIPDGQVPTARSYEFAGPQCCRGRSNQEIPFFPWCFFPKPMFRSPELKTSHSPHKALSVAEDLGQEFQREVKARIRQRKHQYLRFSL